MKTVTPMTRTIALILLFTGISVAIEAHALTAEEIVLLKRNGVSDETIQMMLASERAAHGSGEAETSAGIRTITRPDGKTAIVYTTGKGRHADHQEAERIKEQQAWEMLRRIIVDTRRDTSEGQGADE